MQPLNVARSERASMLSQVFSAFRHYNYRLWFFGQLVSLVGTWMQSTAQGYLIYQLTHSSAYLGLVSFAGGLPTWILILYGGVIADRISRRTMMIITQTVMLILAVILGALVFTNLVQPWHIVLLAFLLGIANAFDAPARMALVIDLVAREDMTNAIAFNATMFNLALIVGPTVGGLTYAAVGPAWCFTLNGISFIAVIIALALMKFKPVPPTPHGTSALKQIKEGFSYVSSEKTIILLTGGVAVVTLFGFGMLTLLPAWAVKILGGNETTYGLLLSARGVGSVFAALMIAVLGSRNMRGMIWTMGSIGLPLAILFLAPVHNIPLALLLMVFLGWGLMSITNTTNAMIQTISPDELRGRVMSIYMLVFQGSMPIGSLLVGFAASKISESTTVVICGAILLVFSVFIWVFRPNLRKLE